MLRDAPSPHPTPAPTPFPAAEHHAKEVELFRHFGIHNPWADAAKKAEWPLVAESGQLLINR
jgi:hypothetical protein